MDPEIYFTDALDVSALRWKQISKCISPCWINGIEICVSSGNWDSSAYRLWKTNIKQLKLYIKEIYWQFLNLTKKEFIFVTLHDVSSFYFKYVQLWNDYMHYYRTPNQNWKQKHWKRFLQWMNSCVHYFYKNILFLENYKIVLKNSFK